MIESTAPQLEFLGIENGWAVFGCPVAKLYITVEQLRSMSLQINAATKKIETIVEGVPV